MANNGRPSPARTPKTSTISCTGFPPYRLRVFGQSDNTFRVSAQEKYWFYILMVLAGVSIPLPPNRAATSPFFLPHPVSPPVTSGSQATFPASSFRHCGLSFYSPNKVASGPGEDGKDPSSPGAATICDLCSRFQAGEPSGIHTESWLWIENHASVAYIAAVPNTWTH